MEEPEILQLYELRYSDLLLLSSPHVSPPSAEETERLELMTRSVMEALGPNGPGLFCITGVPNSSILRRALLPLARKLALLNPYHRRRILKMHNLGSDVPLKNPKRNVSSFATQLRYAQSLESPHKMQCRESDHQIDKEHSDCCITREFVDDEFKHLGDTFQELGICMMELGLHIARICDRVIGGQELEQSLLESSTAKGRLIHYHSTLDSFVLRNAQNRNGISRKQTKSRDDPEKFRIKRMISKNHADVLSQSNSNLWQQWHYDYGIFTVLTAPLFHLPSYKLDSEVDNLFSDEECVSPSGHTFLQIFDPRKNNIVMVNARRDSFIIQVGESADIISKGKLRSTLHSVCRLEEFENLSRETFVVFLQPAWSKTFSVSDYPMETNEPDEKKLTWEIQRIVPPLASRLKDGMTFSEFSRETTKQYYGGSGLQSNR